MTETPNELDETTASNGDGARQRSTIAFPYSPLSDAEQVAEALHRRGDVATMDELAAEMRQTVTSGSFRTRVATARTFGAIEVRRGQVTLTPLGRRLLDPGQQARARVDAFLHVPLYRQVYDEYRGHTLPPPAGIEAAMERFGVSSKQTDRARQALQRSAERAGFFGSGRDRLVSPALANGESEEEKPSALPPTVYTPGGASDPVQAAWLKLLEEGEDWPAEQVKQYVDAARVFYRIN